MSENEIELLGHKKEFIIKITNKLIVSMICCTLSLVAGGSWWASGFVHKVDDHERRIGVIETRQNESQSARNETQRIKNDAAGSRITRIR